LTEGEIVEGLEFACQMAGRRVALLVGSRGISNLPLIVRQVGKQVQAAGGQPFVVAAMGSHGGGTVAGQLEVLAALGITAEAMGFPVQASAQWPLVAGVPVNRLALEADGIIPINRIKPHTSFRGPIESGLAKMLTVGLGGVPGAKAIHAYPLAEISGQIEARSRLILGQLPVVAGVALIENADHATCQVEVVAPEGLLAREKELLEVARRMMPQIPVAQADLLIVEEIGKCFSGTGMDTNVISRLRIAGAKEPPERFRRIIALGLAPAAEGNAYGIGLADFATQALVEATDWDKVRVNALTSGFTMRGMCPLVAVDEAEATRWAAQSLGLEEGQLTWVRIKNTLDLTTIQMDPVTYQGHAKEIAAAGYEVDPSCGD
jgi:hypothetical protein